MVAANKKSSFHHYINFFFQINENTRNCFSVLPALGLPHVPLVAQPLLLSLSHVQSCSMLQTGNDKCIKITSKVSWKWWHVPPDLARAKDPYREYRERERVGEDIKCCAYWEMLIGSQQDLEFHATFAAGSRIPSWNIIGG